MENIEFLKMKSDHADQVMDIFNYYIENTFAAYPDKKLPIDFFSTILQMTNGFPSYVLNVNGNIVGFCFIKSYSTMPIFKTTAEITYFIKSEYSGKGLGKLALQRLSKDAMGLGIERLMANVSSKNIQSISFHKKHGFVECGNFPKIGNKFNEPFDVVWFYKDIINNKL